MRKLNSLLIAAMSAFMACSFTACSDSDDPSGPVVPPINESDYHFDLFLTVGKHGGMSSKNTTIVNSTDSLTAGQTAITITNNGAELTSYSIECISKDQYYYQVPSTNDRFVKYQIKNNKVDVVDQVPFKNNSYKVRMYAHAWTSDSTLVIMAANGDKDKIIWTKLNTNTMSITAEGQLSVSVPEGWEFFSTAGILTYREADGKLFYFYYAKRDKDKANPMRATSESKFRTAVIDAKTMAEEKTDILAPVNSEMAGSAYGQLMQDCVAYDDAGNLYLACFTDTMDIEQGMLLRINAGEYEFDPDYNGYKDGDGKLMTVQYLGNNKALLYARNDKAPTVTINGKSILPSAIDGYSHYYTIADLKTGERTRLSYNGTEIPYSGGRFSQRSVVFNGKAYIGVNTLEDENAIIYIYDTKTGNVTKGAEVAGGFYFDMIRVVKN